jgi:hypothetical protein
MKKIGEGTIPKSIPDYTGYYNYTWVKIGGKNYCYETGQFVSEKPKTADELCPEDE